MSFVRIKADIPIEKESQYSRFKQNSNLKREKSKDKFINICASKIVLKSILGKYEILKNSYLSSKSKIDHTSEDILRQLNSNKSNNLNSNNTYNKSLSYTNLMKTSLSDLQSCLHKNNLNNNIHENFNINNNSLINNNYQSNNYIHQDSLLAKNTSLVKSEDGFFEKLDTRNIKTSDFRLKNYVNDDKNSENISKSSKNFKEILNKLDFLKLKKKKLIEEKEKNLKNIIINKNIIHQENQINKIYLSELNSNTYNNCINKIKSYEDGLHRGKSNEYVKSKEKSNLKDKDSFEQYHTFSKSNNEIVKKENETLVIKNNPYSNYDYKKEKDLRNQKNEEKLILQNELKRKNEDILILRKNFKKKIQLIEDENQKNIEKIDLKFKDLLNNLEESLYINRISEESKEKAYYKILNEIILKLQKEYLDLKNNSIYISNHEEVIGKLKNQLNDQNIQTNFLYSKKINEILEIFENPDYLNLVENMRFYCKYKDKLDFSNFDFNQNRELKSIKEYDIWLDKIKLNIINAETDYLKGTIDLENKYNEFYYEAAYDRNEKLIALENEINTKFSVSFFFI